MAVRVFTASVVVPGSPPATAPSNLSYTEHSGGITLSWSAPSEDAASVTGYQVLRRFPKQGESTLSVRTAVTGTGYTDASGQRNRGHYLSACASYRAAKPRLGISLRTGMIATFSLDGNGPTARFLYENVRPTTLHERVTSLLASCPPA